ncbi:hypothetical protein [Longirhabdus pacifica]|uniref:hypothetical protein n=1 Tax=Longirhabdus pacifica TaxID=2305227 RepID=UPI0010087741|nr:hypothetical protein [Longirhabdus pacifica]
MKKNIFIPLFVIAICLAVIGCSSESKTQDWVESNLFTSESYTFIGEEGKLGFIYDDSDVARFYPDKGHKYMWNFWGSEEELKGVVTVTATHENDDEKSITLFSYRDPWQYQNSSEKRNLPSVFSLPTSGMWKLDAFIDDELFGSIFVKVHEYEE